MESKTKTKTRENAPMILAKPQKANGNSQDDSKIGPYPLVCPQNSETKTEHEPLFDHIPDTPDQPNNPPILQFPTETIPAITLPTLPSLGTNSRLPGHTPLTSLRAKALSQDAENL